MCHVVVDIRVDSRNIVFTGSRLIFYQQKKIVHYKIGKFSFTDLVFSWKELFNISWLPCFNSRMPYNFNPRHGNPFCFSDRCCVQSGIFPGYTSSSSLENSRFSSFWCVVTRGDGRLDRKHLSFLGVKGHLGLTIFLTFKLLDIAERCLTSCTSSTSSFS